MVHAVIAKNIFCCWVNTSLVGINNTSNGTIKVVAQNSARFGDLVAALIFKLPFMKILIRNTRSWQSID